MILSFHPCIPADRNALCAGRLPGPKEVALLRAADATILPQGCGEALYRAAKDNCPRVFPNYDARFRFPGKIDQIELFSTTRVPYPKTLSFPSLRAFRAWSETSKKNPLLGFPFVFKFDWGGEGQTVHAVSSGEELQKVLNLARLYESTGQYGFLIQELILCGDRTLRVVVIGDRFNSYWKVQKDPLRFAACLSQGAVIDAVSDKKIQKVATSSVKSFCRKTGINLAGFDLLFSAPGSPGDKRPLFLEINYFFGRQGLGGSENYYRILRKEVQAWLHRAEDPESEGQ